MSRQKHHPASRTHELQDFLQFDHIPALDLVPAGVCYIDTDYTVLFWNKRLEHFTEILSKNIVGKDLREFFPKLKNSVYSIRLDSVLQGGPPALFSPQLHKNFFPCFLPDGTERLQHTVVSAARKHESNTLYGIIIVQDVTELYIRLKEYSAIRDRALQDLEDRRRAEEALRQNESKLQKITDSALDAVIMINANSTVVFWNPAAEKIFGFTAEEAMGRSILNLITPKSFLQLIKNSLEALQLQSRENEYTRFIEGVACDKNGIEFPIELSLSTVRLNGSWHAVGTIRDITARKENEAKLQEMARMDSLTLLYNRRYFIELSLAELNRCKRHEHAISLLMIDADHFKKINDTFGHDMGDTVLRMMARACKEIFRQEDIIGRIGGEEFAVLLPETTLEGATMAAERLRAHIAATVIDTEDGPLTCSVSIGVTTGYCSAFQGNPIRKLLMVADKALYRAKENGRNRVEVQPIR